MSTLKFFCDDQRHLVCVPYSIENLHRMAEELGIKRCWFHKDHYDIPIRRVKEVQARCIVVPAKWMVLLLHGRRWRKVKMFEPLYLYDATTEPGLGLHHSQ